MLSQCSVVLNFIGDNVEEIMPHLEVGFQERNHVFAIVWVDPDALLEPDGPQIFKRTANVIAVSFTLFFDVKNEQTPFFVPARRPLHSEPFKIVPFQLFQLLFSIAR